MFKYYSYFYTISNTDPFEFNSQDEAEFDKKKEAPKPPPKISTTQIHHHDNQKVIDDDNNETTELLDKQSDKQPPVGKIVADKHSPMVDDEHSDEQSPVPDEQSSVAIDLPVTDEHSPVCVEDIQSPMVDNQSPVAKQFPIIDNQLPIAEELPTGDQQLPVGEKQLPVADTNVVDISCDVDRLHDQLPHHSDDDDNDEYLAMEVERSSDITPSEHGQVVDRSSEDPLNSAASRSEMASTTESPPRHVN